MTALIDRYPRRASSVEECPSNRRSAGVPRRIQGTQGGSRISHPVPIGGPGERYSEFESGRRCRD